KKPRPDGCDRPGGAVMREKATSEYKPQLELNPTRRVPLRRDAPEVRAVLVRVWVVPLHSVQRVDHIDSEFQPHPLGEFNLPRETGVELRHLVAPQPVHARWEDTEVGTYRLEVPRNNVFVGAGQIAIGSTDGAHLRQYLSRDYLPDSRLVGRSVCRHK